MNTKTIKFDLNKYKLYEKIKAKQGDTKSRFLLFQLLDGSIPFNLTNRSVRAYMVKPDGKEIFNDLIINNYSLGYCTLELTNQVLAVSGTVKIELMVTEEDKKLTSSVFELEVVKSINSEKSIVSTNEFTALLNGLASLSEYDNYKNSVKSMEINKADKAKVEEKFGEVYEQLVTIENKTQLHIEDFRISGETDTAVFLKASKSCKTVKLDNKVYEVNSTLELSNFTEFIGDNNTVIICNVKLNEFIKLGHSCKFKNVRIFINEDISCIFDINTEWIKSSIDYNTIYNYYSDIALYNITIDNVVIFKKESTYGGNGIYIHSTGKGLNGWGIALKNVEIQGNLNNGIVFRNEQKYPDGEDIIVPWITDTTIENVKMVNVKNGLLIEKIEYENDSTKIPQTPQFIKIKNMSVQWHANAEYFAVIKNAKNIYFEKCMPWDWNKSSNRPYKIYEDVSDLKIDDVFSYGVEEIKNKNSENSNQYNTPFAVYGGGYSKSFLPIPINESGIYTMKELYNLPVGSYEVNMDGSLATRFGLPQSVTQYGATLVVEGGYLGRRNITLIPSCFNYSTKKPKFNLAIYMLVLNFPRSQGSLDTFLDAELERDMWYELKDIKNGGNPYGSTSERPSLISSDKGFMFYDATLGKPIWWNGTRWIDANGSTV